MKNSIYSVGFSVLICLIALFLVQNNLGILSSAFSESSNTTKYVCPMKCKNAIYDAAGTCPVCGMDLVPVGSEKIQSPKKAAILIFDGVQIIDFSAPYEVFGQQKFEVFTVAEKNQPITTSMNLSLNPTYTLKNAPQPDVLIIPGGNVDPHLDNSQVIDWIKKNAQKAEYVLSVCNGAFFLAKAGLLDGLKATTFHHLISELARVAPKTEVVSDKRFVDNGKIITSAGLTSGMDASLHVIERMYGKGEAQQLALHLEYNWQPDSDFARAALADKYLTDLNLPQGARWKYLSTAGGTDHWKIEGLLYTNQSLSELLLMVTDTLQKNNWKKTSGENGTTSQWNFSDEKGKRWNGDIAINKQSDEANAFHVTIQIQRT